MNVTYINYKNISADLKFEKTFNGAEYIKAYAHPANQADINLTENNINYKINSIYITGRNHELPNQEYEGELIIENVSTIDSNMKKYVVFPLQISNTVVHTTDINKIINSAKSPTPDKLSKININILEDASSVTTYLTNYNNIKANNKIIEKNTVIIFHQSPIIINSAKFPSKDSAEIIFPKYKNDDYISRTIIDINAAATSTVSAPADGQENFESLTEKTAELWSSMTWDEIFSKKSLEGFAIAVEPDNDPANPIWADKVSIQCSPTGSSEETIQMASVPINDGILAQIGQVSIMGTTINFFVFTCLVILIAIVSPFIYKYAVVQLVKTAVPQQKARPGSLFAMDLFLVLLSLAFSITIAVMGITMQNFVLSCVGVGFCIYVFLSISIIYFNKINDCSSFSLLDFPGQQYTINGQIFVNFWHFFVDNWKDLAMSYVLFLGIVSAVIFFAIGYYGMAANQMFLVYSIILFYGFFMCFFLVYNYKIKYDIDLD